MVGYVGPSGLHLAMLGKSGSVGEQPWDLEDTRSLEVYFSPLLPSASYFPIDFLSKLIPPRLPLLLPQVPLPLWPEINFDPFYSLVSLAHPTICAACKKPGMERQGGRAGLVHTLVPTSPCHRNKGRERVSFKTITKPCYAAGPISPLDCFNPTATQWKIACH